MAKHAVQMIPATASRPASPAAEEDWLALHPMHQWLVAEFEFAGTAEAPLSRAARLSAIFYIGASAWVVIAGIAWGFARAA